MNDLLVIAPGQAQQAGKIQNPESLELCFIIKKCHYQHFSHHFLRGYLSERGFVVVVVLVYCLLVCSQQVLVIHIKTQCQVIPSDFEAPFKILIVPSSCWRTFMVFPESRFYRGFLQHQGQTLFFPMSLHITVLKLSHFLFLLIPYKELRVTVKEYPREGITYSCFNYFSPFHLLESQKEKTGNILWTY